ncbi:hypothetical protein F5Y19DRAFT_156067 [Xylariaceae sp. FL1651]|nr:hypothetical protein F5Y19DRAFT_156067 [Xylariaceae sp. FL1651]
MPPPEYERYGGFTVNDALAAAGAPPYTGQFLDGEPPMKFFAEPPKNCAAVLSTAEGTRPFRLVHDTTFKREGYYWWAAEIQRVCDELRQNLPGACNNIEPLESYLDLYNYFDAYDIYYRGAQNLWNVIHTLLFENYYKQEILLLKKQMKEQPADLYRKTTETAGGPLPDKLDVSSKIINRIVIADGTSATAARKAGYKGVVPSATTIAQQKAQNNAADKIPSSTRIIAGATPDSRISSMGRTTHSPPPKARYASAPNTGGKPSGISGADITRIYPGSFHDVREKLRGCQKPDSPKDTSDNAPVPTDTSQDIVSAPDSELHRIPSVMDRILPSLQSINTSRHASGRRSSPIQPVLSTSRAEDIHKKGPTYRLTQSIVSPSRVLENQSCGVSQAPFAHRTPTYSPPQLAQAPPVTQQAQGGLRSHKQANTGNDPSNSTTPNKQAEFSSEHNTPHIHLGGSGTSQQQQQQKKKKKKKNVDTACTSNGKWQQVGTDIHGPKAVFRKGSMHGQQEQDHEAGQGRRKGSNEATIQPSGATNNTHYQRLSNAELHEYSNHNNTLYAESRRTIPQASASITEPFHSSGAWALSSPGYSMGSHFCVNAGRPCDIRTKFDPCPCENCYDRDRTIYVSRLKQDLNLTSHGKELVKRYFSKYGTVENVVSPATNRSAIHVKFTNPQAAVAAVKACHYAKIDELGDLPIRTSFRIGSQFFNPIHYRHAGYNTNNQTHHLQNTPHGQQATTHQSALDPSTNLGNIQSGLGQDRVPEQLVVSPSPVILTGHSPSVKEDMALTHAMNLLNRANTQSTPGRQKSNVSPRPGSNNPPQYFPSSQRISPIKGVDLPDATFYQPQHVPSFGTREASELSTGETKGKFEITASRQGSHSDTPSNATQGDDDTLQRTISHNAAGTQYSPTQPPQGQGSADPTNVSEAQLSYGTVRIRSAKAKYVPLPPDWRQEPSPLHPDRESQHEAHEKKSPLGHERSGKPRNTSPHTKRKANETDADEEMASQLSPKKKVATEVKLAEPRQDYQVSHHEDQQQAHEAKAHRQLKTNKKKKKKNRRTGLQPPPPLNNAGVALYVAEAFTPDISASNFPPYPQRTIPAEGQQTAAPQSPGALHIQVPPLLPAPIKPRLDANEPFPPYRDLMSGHHDPVKGHKNPATGYGMNKSTSSNTSTIIQDFGEDIHRRTPIAENFVPSPPDQDSAVASPQKETDILHIANRPPKADSIVPQDQSFPTEQDQANQKPDFHTENSTSNKQTYDKETDSSKVMAEKAKKPEDKDDTVPDVTNKENGANSGAKSNGGKAKSKHTKSGKNDGKSANSHVATDKKPQPPAEQKPEPLKPDTSKHAAATASAANASNKPKQKKPKTQPGSKKGNDIQPADKASDKASNTTAKNAGSKEPAESQPSKSLINADDFPALPSPTTSTPITRMKSISTLEPMPLPPSVPAGSSAWKKVAAPAPATPVVKNPKDRKESVKMEGKEKVPLGEERKGG